MRRRARRAFFVLILAIVLAVSAPAPHPISACGGFFCANSPINQNAERIIFAVDSAHQKITAVVGINYVGDAKDFSWIVPVPSRPMLAVAETQSLDTLQAATDVQISPPPQYCNQLYPEWQGGFGGGGGGGGVEEGHVGPYDYAILSSSDPTEVVTWLRTNGYRVTPAMEPIIMQYVREGKYFLAMRLSQDASVGDIKPIVMTYSAIHPMIPIRLTAVAAVDNMPILTWIFGDTQYVPENYAHPQPDFGAFRSPPAIESTDGVQIPVAYFSPLSLYPRALQDVQDRYNGQALVTEYAAPTASLLGLLAINDMHDDLLSSLSRKYAYITRLRGQMSPGQMTLDPTFIPDPAAKDVSNVVNLGDRIDPLIYWGCSSRAMLDAIPSQDLPPGRTRIDNLRLSIAHPDGWLLSSFDFNGNGFWALSPRRVDQRTLKAFLAGENTPPMFVVARVPVEDMEVGAECDPCTRPAELLLDLFGAHLEQGAPLPDSFEERVVAAARFNPVGPDTLDGFVFGILASSKEWRVNVAAYGAMLDYAGSYQYYLDPAFRDSLFLDGLYGVPLAADWSARLNSDGDILLTPPSTQKGDIPAMMRLTLVERFFRANETQDDFDLAEQRAIQWAQGYYGLTSPLKPSTDICQGQKAQTLATQFDHDGQTGSVILVYGYVVAVSARSVDFANYRDLFASMLNGILASHKLDPCN